jgi:hypothetical protein
MSFSVKFPFEPDVGDPSVCNDARLEQRDAGIGRLRNKQLSGAQKVQIDLIDYLFEPSSFPLKFNAYLDR